MQLSLLLLALPCLAIARPAPEPLHPTLAQGLIAALTLAHTGMIAYALARETSEQSLIRKQP
jgi:hypothetical protein